MLVDQQLLEALAKFPSGTIETYGENLDLVRFPRKRYQRIFTDYLTGKYADRAEERRSVISVHEEISGGTTMPHQDGITQGITCRLWRR